MNAKINTSIYTRIVLYCGSWWFLLVVHCVEWDQTEGLFGVSLRDGACSCAKSPAYTNILQRACRCSQTKPKQKHSRDAKIRRGPSGSSKRKAVSYTLYIYTGVSCIGYQFFTDYCLLACVKVKSRTLTRTFQWYPLLHL